jgi:hypothetical protein
MNRKQLAHGVCALEEDSDEEHADRLWRQFFWIVDGIGLRKYYSKQLVMFTSNRLLLIS